MATNSIPGRTARESCVTPVTSMPRQIGRGDRPAVAPRAAQPVLRREALHQPLEPTPSRADRSSLKDARRPRREAPERVGQRLRRRARAPRSSRPSAPRTTACARTARPSDRPRPVRDGRVRRRRRRGPSPCSPRGWRAGSRASGGGASRPGWVSRTPGRQPNGRSTAGRRGGTGSGPPSEWVGSAPSRASR